MSEAVEINPTHLDPSELGTKEYWDKYYQNDLDLNTGTGEEGDDEEQHHPPSDPADLESWFDDVDAPAKVLEYLTSEDFPYSPNNPHPTLELPRILDLGTGNGSMLFTLRMEGGYTGSMVGVDYSQQSVDLARQLWKRYSDAGEHGDGSSVRFETLDLIRHDAWKEEWWSGQGFDLVLDKGTFDAISLSSETFPDASGIQRRIYELYPAKVVDLVAPGGYLLITSCNWTEEEVLKWFLQTEGVQGRLELFGKIEYPVYQFGGQQGAGVASVCFRRVTAT